VAGRSRDNTHTSDAECVRQARAGDLGGFDELIRRYQQRATSVAYRLLGNVHDASEVCQEAFIRAFQNLDTLSDPDRFRPWLLRIVTNLSLNFRRARGNAATARTRLEDAMNARLANDQGTSRRNGRAGRRPESELMAIELGEIVRTALDELTEQQRLALVLFSIEELPQREVAAIMECSVEAVKWHVFRARQRLRELLHNHL
jgi:RNA polymerase sigma-70 factor (ECF subfamily)